MPPRRFLLILAAVLAAAALTVVAGFAVSEGTGGGAPAALGVALLAAALALRFWGRRP